MIFKSVHHPGYTRYYFLGKNIFTRTHLRRYMEWHKKTVEEQTRRTEVLEERVKQMVEHVRVGLDAAKLPRAQGWLRNIQVATTKILKEIDQVCSQEGITYWIDSGTALGAIRHGGFIPWDDDADLGMLRQDMMHFFEVFSRKKSPELSIRYWSDRLWTVARVELTKVPQVSVDIFAFDFYNGAWNTMEERKELSATTKTIRKDLINEAVVNTCIDAEIFAPGDTRERPMPTELQDKLCFFETMTKKFMTEHPAPTSDKPDIFLGMEFSPLYEEEVFYPYDAILPTIRVPFEDTTLCMPHDPHTYLTYCYGDYMRLPENIGAAHGRLQRLDASKALYLKEYISL